MERPAKRQKLSSSGLPPYPNDHARQDGELSCTHADAKTEGVRGRLVVPTPTLNKYDLRRRYVFDGSSKRGRNQLPGRDAAALIVPRAPDTTVLATAVDVNVQDGSTTIANTLILQASDATVISFTSLGAVTVGALPSASGNTTTTSDSGVTSSGASLPTNGLSSSLPAGYNSSATNTSDNTVTLTLTSTLNVSFLNGTFVTLSNPSNTNTSATTTPSASNTNSRSTIISATSDLSNSLLAGGTASTNNGPGAAPSSGRTGAAGFGSPTTAVSSATSSSSSNTGSGPDPATPIVVGGVVGGVAGLAFLLLILLALLRWYRKRLQSRGQLPEQIAARAATGGGPSAATQMSSHTPFAAAILSSTRRWRPQSSATTATAVTNYSSVPDSERGFQRIAGRKIAPVIGSGSDQYGGNYGAFERDLAEGRLTRGAHPSSQAAPVNNEDSGLADKSFYRDSQGFYGGKGDPRPTSSTLVSSSLGHTRGSTRDPANTDSIGEDLREDATEGYAVMRPSPARTPITSSPSNSSLRLPIQQGPLMEPGAPPTPALPPYLTGRRQDSVGRSLGSQDGSRGSKFTESL